MKRVESASLFGILPTSLGVPGMMIPLFVAKGQDDTLIQETDRNGKVAGFIPFDSTWTVPAMEGFSPVGIEMPLTVGDEPVFALALDQENFIVAKESEFKKAIDFSDPRLADNAHLRLDLADFCGNKRAAKRAMGQIERQTERATVPKVKMTASSLPPSKSGASVAKSFRGVLVKKGEPVDRALKRLKTKLDTEGILEEMRRRRAFESPAARKLRKARTAPKRHKVRWRYVDPSQAAKTQESADLGVRKA